jgi:hypothetical protein
MADEWITDAELEKLKEPIDPPGLYEAVAATRLRRKAVAATDTLIDLAMNAANESVRLRAATYILDRTLGPVANPHNSNPGGAKAPWEDVYDAVLVEPSKNDFPSTTPAAQSEMEIYRGDIQLPPFRGHYDPDELDKR